MQTTIRVPQHTSKHTSPTSRNIPLRQKPIRHNQPFRQSHSNILQLCQRFQHQRIPSSLKTKPMLLIRTRPKHKNILPRTTSPHTNTMHHHNTNQISLIQLHPFKYQDNTFPHQRHVHRIFRKQYRIILMRDNIPSLLYTISTHIHHHKQCPGHHHNVNTGINVIYNLNTNHNNTMRIHTIFLQRHQSSHRPRAILRLQHTTKGTLT